MNFQLAAIGHSFKGSMAYYLHDKRQDEAAAHPETSERVAWTELRNLAAAAGPETATRLMIATAQSADQLKAAAGIKATGRKATAGPVFAFSLAWHPDERADLTREQMTAAADHALKVLKLDQLQAVIIAHQDTPHPHVHVVVNRVNPETGKSATIAKPDVLKLNAWADAYERECGKIVSPNRAAKFDKINAARAEHPDPELRRQHVEQQRRRRSQAKAEDPGRVPPGQILKDLDEAQKAAHRREWKEWGESARTGRKAIYDRHDARRQAALASFKDETRPDWARHFRAERDRARAFEAREGTLSGLVVNALAAAKQQFREQSQGPRGILSLTFANVLSSAARRQAFEQAQEKTAREFRAAMAERRRAYLAALDAEKRAALIEQSRRVDAAKAAMIDRQNAERAKMREAWRQHYASAAPGRANRPRQAPPQTRAPQPRPAGMGEAPRSQTQTLPIDSSAAISGPRVTNWGARYGLAGEHARAAEPPKHQPSGPRLKP